jgi:DNA-binding Xre family transcriptional regulator
VVLLDHNGIEKTLHLRTPFEARIMITPADKKVLKKFGENLRKLRKEKGLSLREMSYACSIDNSKIAKIEKGMINITFTTLLQLAVALEAQPAILLEYEPE